MVDLDELKRLAEESAYLRNHGLLQAARQAQAALKKWRMCAGVHPYAGLIYEACSYLESAIEREDALRTALEELK